MSGADLAHGAAEGRRAAIARGAHYRRDWLDSDRWDELAKTRGMRLPQWHRPPTARALKSAARSQGNLDFEAIFGCSPSRAIGLNPRAGLRAFIGWLLEAESEKKEAAALENAAASGTAHADREPDATPTGARGQSET